MTLRTEPSRNHRPTHGFTLVELLVVIVIIVTLAVLSFMSLRRIRASADAATTASVLRQLQLANVGYANDHNGQYVPMESYDENNVRGNEWHYSPKFIAYLTGDQSALDKGRKTVDAPISVLDPVAVRAKGRMWDKLFASYGYNQQGMPPAKPSSDRSFKTSQVNQPSRSAAFITATDWKVIHAGRFRWLENPVEGKSTNQQIAYRHGGKAIVVYYDGSSGMVSPADMRDFDNKGGANHPFWRADAK